MAGIAQRSDLVTQINNYCNRTFSTTLTDLFIQSAESRFWYGTEDQANPELDAPPMRIRAMETTTTPTISSQSTSLPTGFLANRRLYITSGSSIIELDYLTPDVFWRTWTAASGATGQPEQFTIEGENFIVGPMPDVSYTSSFLYYKALTALVNSSDTNWILTNMPLAYLSATLTEAFAYTRNMEQAVAWNSRYVSIARALQTQDKRDRYAGPWRTQVDTGQP